MKKTEAPTQGPYKVKKLEAPEGEYWYTVVDANGRRAMSLAMHEPRADLMAYALNAAWLSGRSSLDAALSKPEVSEEEIESIGRERYPPDTTNDGDVWYSDLQATKNTYFKSGLRYARDRGLLSATKGQGEQPQQEPELLRTGWMVDGAVNNEGFARLTFTKPEHEYTAVEVDVYAKSTRSPQAPDNSGAWISVEDEDKLPPIHREPFTEDGFVLILFQCADWPGKWKTMKASRTIGDWAEDGSELWYWTDEEGEIIDDDDNLITHWQPITPPPQQ